MPSLVLSSLKGMYILIDLVVTKPGVWFLFQRMGERLIKPLYAPAGTEA